MADNDKHDEAQTQKLNIEHVEGRPQIQGSIWHELWAVRTVIPYILIIYCCVVNVGLDSGIAGLTLGIVSFRRQFGTYLNDSAGWVIPNTYTSAWSGASVGSQTIGNMLSGLVADRWGRKWALICSAVITIIATVIMICSRTIGPLIAGKLVMGLGIGFLVAQAPAFLAEMSTPRLRGMTTIGVNFCICAGQWLASGIIWGATSRWTDVEDNTAWLVVFGLQFIFATIFLATVWFLPESPVYLVQTKRIEEAHVNARKLFGSQYDAVLHVNNIVLEVTRENEAQEEGKSISYLEPLQRTDLRRTLIGCMVFVGQVLSGNLFVLNYQNYFYELAGLKDAAMLAFVNYCVAMVGNICSYFVVDTVGRRPLYVYGSLGLAIANLLVGLMSILQGSDRVKAGYVAVFGLSLWSFIYQCCVGTTAFAINGEIPSNRLRAKTNAWVNLVNALVSFAISYAIPPLFQPDAANLGLKMGYLFGGCAVVLFALSFFFLPETVGRTSWELDRLFEARVSARKFKQASFDSAGDIVPSSVGRQSSVDD